MDINALKQKIDGLNKRSAEVNTLRNQNIGRKETLEAQFKKLIAEYKEKYGVDLTPETLDAEIQRVVAEKEAEANKIESALNCIDNGDFSHANAILGVAYEEEAIKNMGQVSKNSAMDEIMHRDFNATPSEPTKASEFVASNGGVSAPVVQPVAQEPAPVAQEPVQEAVSEPVVVEKPVAPPVQEEPVAPPTPPVAPSAPPVAPSAPAQPKVTSAFDFASTFEEDKVAPPTPPTPPVAPKVATPQGNPSGLNIGVAPPEPPKAKTTASFEAMFGGTAFTGGN